MVKNYKRLIAVLTLAIALMAVGYILSECFPSTIVGDIIHVVEALTPIFLEAYRQNHENLSDAGVNASHSPSQGKSTKPPGLLTRIWAKLVRRFSRRK